MELFGGGSFAPSRTAVLQRPEPSVAELWCAILNDVAHRSRRECLRSGFRSRPIAALGPFRQCAAGRLPRGGVLPSSGSGSLDLRSCSSSWLLHKGAVCPA
jgi:hypothetical protein